MDQALRSNLLFPSQCHFDWDLVSSWRGDRDLSAYSKSPTVGNWQTCFVLVFLIVRFFVVVRILTFHFDGSFCLPEAQACQFVLKAKGQKHHGMHDVVLEKGGTCRTQDVELGVRSVRFGVQGSLADPSTFTLPVSPKCTL